MGDTRRGLFERLLAVYVGGRVAPGVLGVAAADAAQEALPSVPPAPAVPVTGSVWPGATYTTGRVLAMSATCSMTYGATTFPAGPPYVYRVDPVSPPVDRLPPPEPV